MDDGVDATAETDHTAEREDPSFPGLPDPLESAPLGADGEPSARR